MWLFGKPTRKKFAARTLAAIRRAGSNEEYVYDPDRFRLCAGDSNVINLENLYGDYCALPRRERNPFLAQIVSELIASRHACPDDLEAARPNLLPKVWSRITFELIGLESAANENSPDETPLYLLGSHLYSSVVYDLPASIQSIPASRLETWGISYYEALEIARQNLQQRPAMRACLGDRLHSFLADDAFNSARILLLDQIAALPVVGEHVALVPHRDALFVAGSDDPESLRMMFELAGQPPSGSHRPLCPLPLVLREGEWEDWVPPPGHPVRPKYDELHRQFLGELYNDQKQSLDRLYENRNVDVFVATYSGLQLEGDNHYSTYCVWSRGCTSLLPRTEFVMFVDESGLVASGKWERVEQVVGRLMEREESLYPVRRRVTAFPDAAELTRIGQISGLKK